MQVDAAIPPVEYERLERVGLVAVFRDVASSPAVASDEGRCTVILPTANFPDRRHLCRRNVVGIGSPAAPIHRLDQTVHYSRIRPVYRGLSPGVDRLRLHLVVAGRAEYPVFRGLFRERL